MDFELNEEQKALRALARDFCTKEVDWKYLAELANKPVGPENVRDRMPWDLIKKADDVGLRTLSVPEEYGGGGANWLTQFAVAEELGYSGGPFGTILTGNWKHARDLAYWGTQEQREEFLTRFVNNYRYTLAGSWHEAGPNIGAVYPYDAPPGEGLQTFAYKDGDEWVINGEKDYCSGCGVADLILVTVKIGKDKPMSQSGAVFLVPTDTPGFSVARINDFMANPNRVNAALRFEDCRVPARCLFGAGEGKGAVQMHGRLAGKIIHYGCLIGWAQKIYELAKEYTKTRIQGGQPIFEHKNIGTEVVELGLLIEAARLLGYRSCWELEKEQKERGPTNVNGLWYFISGAYWKLILPQICGMLPDILGGPSMDKELPYEGFIREMFMWLHGGETRSGNLIDVMGQIDAWQPTGRV